MNLGHDRGVSLKGLPETVGVQRTRHTRARHPLMEVEVLKQPRSSIPQSMSSLCSHSILNKQLLLLVINWVSMVAGYQNKSLL